MASFVEIAHCELPYPPDMTVVYIKFRHDGGNSSLDITKNGSTEVEVPEWYPGESNRDENMAYIKNQTSRKIKVKFWIDRTGMENWGAFATASGDDIGDVDQENFDFDGEQYSEEILMEFDGSVPGSVGKRNFSLSWYGVMPGEPDVEYSIGSSGAHYYYTVLTTPQSPMASPWTSVLDYSCDWASGETTNSGAADEITEGIYDDLGDTDGDIDYDPDSDYMTGYFTFDLTSFLSDLGSSSSVTVNCDDTGNLFAIFATALGLSAQSRVRTTPVAITTNSIDCIGSPGWTTYDNWYHHHFGWFNSLVYEPCLRVNQGSPILPKGMNQTTNEETYLIDEGSFNGTDTQSTTVE
jgi:hypothetical protein